MELEYTNQSGDRLLIKQRSPYFLQNIDGTGNFRQMISTFHAPSQDGAFFISSSLEMRNITLEGTIVAKTIDHARELQKWLMKVFTPKGRGTLVYRDMRITCHVEELVFAVGTGARYPVFYISLLCPTPFFEALEQIRAELAAWIGGFSFPLEIPETGFEMGHREPSQIITVDNAGDVNCGCTISFKSLGTIANPELMNVNTGEVVRLLKVMTAGEEMRVYTHFAGKRVIQVIGGSEINAFSYMDTLSTFLQLAPGPNTLRYSATSNLDLLEVTVFFRPLYLGV